MNKLKQVEDKIKELVPEIMELKFGCEIQFEIPLMRAIWTSRIIDYLSTDDKIYVDHGKTMEVIPRMYIKKILGRPITLFDIKQCLMYNGYAIKEFSEIAEIWQAPDSLDRQSDKLIDKLYNYVKKNKNG